MQTIAWLALILGGILIRQVSKGRATNLPEDVRDMFVGIVTADTAAVSEVAARTGEPAYTPVTPVASETPAVVTGDGSGSALLSAAMKRGAAAKGYRFGTYPPNFGVGPDWYDCSGLVTKALQDIGVKTGRVTTFTWPRVAAKLGYKQVSKPTTGDVVVWQQGGTSGHMGIVTTGGKFYGAHSPRTGIKEVSMAPVKGTISYWHRG